MKPFWKIFLVIFVLAGGGFYWWTKQSGGKPGEAAPVAKSEGKADGKAPGISPMGNPLPAGALDTMAISWAAYGTKRGIYRILDALAAHKAKASVMTNAIVAERAPEAVRAVADAGLDFLEQPVAGHDLAGMAAVAAASVVAIGADEGIHSADDIARHHAQGPICRFYPV